MTTQLPPFSPWHIPPLFVATTFTFGGLLPVWNPARAIREFGLPQRFETNRDAGAVMAVYGSRMTWIGILIYSFYAKGDLRAINTVLSYTFVAGAADGWVCWKEGLPGRALFRLVSSLLLSAYGYCEMASW